MLHFTAPLLLLVASAFAGQIPIEKFDPADATDMGKYVDECKLLAKNIKCMLLFL